MHGIDRKSGYGSEVGQGFPMSAAGEGDDVVRTFRNVRSDPKRTWAKTLAIGAMHDEVTRGIHRF
jgi:hypothetical protein